MQPYSMLFWLEVVKDGEMTAIACWGLTKQHIGQGFFIVNALGSKWKRRLKAQLKIMRNEGCGNRTQATQERISRYKIQMPQHIRGTTHVERPSLQRLPSTKALHCREQDIENMPH